MQLNSAALALDNGAKNTLQELREQEDARWEAERLAKANDLRANEAEASNLTRYAPMQLETTFARLTGASRRARVLPTPSSFTKTGNSPF